MAGANYDFPSDPKPLDDQGNWTIPWAQWVQRTHSNARTLQQSGTTADRPTSNLWIGRQYFDTTLGQMVWVQSVTAGVATWVAGGGGGGGAAWGSITGTLSAQTDLQAALNLKAPLASPAFTGTATAVNMTYSGLALTAASTTTGAGFNVPPGAAPTTPNNGDMWSTAAGFFVRVAGVTVGPLGAAGVALNTVNVFTKNQSVAPVINSSASGTITPDASLSNNFQYTLVGNVTFANPTNLSAGMELNVCMDEDATGGRTIAFGTQYIWPSGVTPSWVLTPTAKNYFSAYYDGATLRCTGGPYGVVTTFDPSKKGANIALSGSNLVATKNTNAAYNSVLTNTSKASGQWYFEITITQNIGGTNFIVIGVAPSTASLTNFVGFDAASYGYYQATGQKVNNNVLAAYGSAYTQGQTIGVAVDLTAGKIWFAINNVWQASGNPTAGTNPAYTGVSGTLFGGASIYNGTVAPVDVVTGRFAAGTTVYTPPSGFSYWG